MHTPADALESPRFTGPRTFARLPLVADLEGVDCAVYGIPWDGSASFRAGSRFGPEAIRAASVLLRPYNAEQRTAVFGSLSVIDHGDAPTVPGYVEDTFERVAAFAGRIAQAGVVPLALGGDHSVTLPQLRALAAVHGPLGLVQLDAHSDLWDSFFGRPYSHGTVFRRAIDEGLVDPARCFQAGMRGTLYGPADVQQGHELGTEVARWAEIAPLAPAAFADRVRARVGTGPTFLTFDIDFFDPAFAPATGTPECGGPTSHHGLGLVRALTGIDFVGFDVVEVAPQYDGPGQVTSLLAATVAYELLTLLALRAV
ncbi:MAG: agmatinase [Thermoleophilia bacterium]